MLMSPKGIHKPWTSLKKPWWIKFIRAITSYAFYLFTISVFSLKKKWFLFWPQTLGCSSHHEVLSLTSRPFTTIMRPLGALTAIRFLFKRVSLSRLSFSKNYLRAFSGFKKNLFLKISSAHGYTLLYLMDGDRFCHEKMDAKRARSREKDYGQKKLLGPTHKMSIFLSKH